MSEGICYSACCTVNTHRCFLGPFLSPIRGRAWSWPTINRRRAHSWSGHTEKVAPAPTARLSGLPCPLPCCGIMIRGRIPLRHTWPALSPACTRIILPLRSEDIPALQASNETHRTTTFKHRHKHTPPGHSWSHAE